MLLEKIDFDSSRDFIYMERYVNIGSPSGFTNKFTTSIRTSAKGPYENFFLCSVNFPENIAFQDFGVKPDFFKWRMLVHPDMINEKMFSICSNINHKSLLVAPTASSRTVKAFCNEEWFLKLNYRGLIGRCDRGIGKNQALSAIEVSDIIAKAIDKKTLPQEFFLMREVFARVIDLKDNNSVYEFGIVLREPKTYPKSDKIKYLIPAFSLFSKDDKNPEDETLLTQLIRKQSKNISDFLFEDIIRPIYESYFQILINCGLQLECHAQNTLIGIDKNYKVTGIIARDTESIDKDLTLMNQLKISNIIKSTEYKCLRKEDYNYQIMHSFMFDFKLGEYLISPIIENAFQNFTFDKDNLLDRIKQYNNNFINKLPKDFFPLDGKWYSYKNVVHDRAKKRDYIGKSKPNFR